MERVVNLAMALWSVSLVFQLHWNMKIIGDKMLVIGADGTSLVEYKLESAR
jgi:hypothetical protein